MEHSIWHNYLFLVSFIACIAGLCLLAADQQALLEEATTEAARTEYLLIRMSFTYWIVYCVAIAAQHITLPTWEVWLMSLKLTAVISYLLTFTCILTVPLHRFAASHQTVK